VKARRMVAIGVVVVSLGLLGAAGWLAFGKGPTMLGDVRETALPESAPPGGGTVATGVVLEVGCNAPSRVWVEGVGGGEVVRAGRCLPGEGIRWEGLEAGTYRVHGYNHALDVEYTRVVGLFEGEGEVWFTYPGLLVVEPEPEGAEVEVNGRVYRGATRVWIAGEECPYRARIVVRAAGYREYGREVVVKAGEVSRHPIVLEGMVTVVPTAVRVVPTAVRATGMATVVPFPVEERVELVRRKLYEKVNCWRAQGGMGPVPYLVEWQGLADAYAAAWRDHFRRYGVEGFEDTGWREQFWAAGGDAVPDNAAMPLYAPEGYVNTAPRTRWESFDMCDRNLHLYWQFWERRFDQKPITGVVIGMAPWWDGDILEAAVVIGWKW